MEFQNRKSLRMSSRLSVQSQATNTRPGSGILTAPAGSAAFSRIFSGKNIRTQGLPSFMQLKGPSSGLTQKDLSLMTLMNTAQSSSILSSSSREELKEDSSKHSSSGEREKQPKQVEDLIATILNSNLNPQEVVLRFRNRTLKRQDLVCFREQADFPVSIVDAYMSMLKQVNRTQVKKSKARKVLISSTSFSEAVFLEGKASAKNIKTNILAYDWLLFPMQTENWTLLAVDLKQKAVYYYDPLKEHSQINSILTNLFNFIKDFLAAHRNTKIEEAPWKELHLEPQQTTTFARRDSGTFTCKQAELIALGKDRKLEPRSSQNYRKDILTTLIRTSLHS